MDVDLPPVIAVRRFLREQRARRDAFHGWCDNTYVHQWKQAARSKPTAQVLQAFASGIDEALEQAGAVNLQRQGTPDRLRLKAPATFKVQGHVLWPINLGENATSDDPAHSVEAALIMQSKAQVSASKVTVSEAPLCLGWTHHALKRLCERGGGMAELDDVLGASTREIGEALATALMTGLFKPDTQAGTANTVWVPYREGLLIFTDRILTTHVSTPAVGWRLDYRRRQFNGDNVRSDFLLPYIATSTYQGPRVINVAMWFATTFIGAQLLSPVQQRYAELFGQLMRALGPAEAARLFAIRFDPGQRLEEILKKPVALTDQVLLLITDLKTMLASAEFPAKARELGTLILNDDVTTRTFKASLQEREDKPESAFRAT